MRPIGRLALIEVGGFEGLLSQHMWASCMSPSSTSVDLGRKWCSKQGPRRTLMEWAQSFHTALGAMCLGTAFLMLPAQPADLSR